MSKATALVSYARLPLPNRTICRKCSHELNMENKVTATLKSMLQFHVLYYWLRTWLLPENSALTGMFQERIPTISMQQPILLNPDPHRHYDHSCTKANVYQTLPSETLFFMGYPQTLTLCDIFHSSCLQFSSRALGLHKIFLKWLDCACG